MKATLLFIVALIMVLGVVSGCNDSPEHSDEPLLWMRMAVAEDTLFVAPDTSASTTGWVEVREGTEHGQPLAGTQVQLDLLAGSGGICFIDSTLRDATNPGGRVNFRYIIYNWAWPGLTVLRAQVSTETGNYVQTASVHLLPRGQWGTVVRLVLARDSIRAQDSARVTVSLRDMYRNAVWGVQLPLITSGGSVESLPPTNDDGEASAWWHLNGAAPGRYHIVVRWDGSADTAWVTVVP